MRENRYICIVVKNACQLTLVGASGLRRGALGERDEAAAASNHNSAMLSGSQLSRLALAYRAFQGGPEMCERAASLYTQVSA